MSCQIDSHRQVGEQEGPPQNISIVCSSVSFLCLKIRTLRRPAGAASVAPHRHSLLLLLDILEELHCALQLPAVDGLGRLSRILERDAEVGAASAGRLLRRDLGRCVSNLARNSVSASFTQW